MWDPVLSVPKGSPSLYVPNDLRQDKEPGRLHGRWDPCRTDGTPPRCDQVTAPFQTPTAHLAGPRIWRRPVIRLRVGILHSILAKSMQDQGPGAWRSNNAPISIAENRALLSQVPVSSSGEAPQLSAVVTRARCVGLTIRRTSSSMLIRRARLRRNLHPERVGYLTVTDVGLSVLATGRG